MAIGNGIRGMIIGSAGDLTYSVKRGEQVISARVVKTTNPRTPAQMVQRIKLSNILALYRSFHGLLNECFDQPLRKSSRGLPPVYNRFVSLNLFSLPVYLTRTEYATGYCIAAPYLVSDGSLPAILTRSCGPDTLTDIFLGDLQLTPDTPVSQFSLAVIRHNPLYFPGDSLLHLDLLQYADPATGVPLVSAHLYTVTLDPADTRPLRSVTPSIGFSSISSYLARPSAPDTACPSNEKSPDIACLSHEKSPDPCAFAWIHTRLTPEGLQASPQRLILHNPLFQLYNSDTARARALRSYDARSVPISPGE